MLAHISLLTAFFDMLQGLLQKNLAGIHFLFFVSTMQRGGTCAAHGIDVHKNVQFFIVFSSIFSFLQFFISSKRVFYLGKITILKVFAETPSLHLPCIF